MHFFKFKTNYSTSLIFSQMRNIYPAFEKHLVQWNYPNIPNSSQLLKHLDWAYENNITTLRSIVLTELVYRFLFYVLVSCCPITKSFLTYSFVLPTPTLSTVCRPLSGYVCSITPETANVGSSYSHMRGPGVGCWFSYRSNCSHWSFEAAVLPINPNIYTDQWEPIVIYHSITFTGRYTTMQPTLLTCWLQLLSYKV